MITTVTKIENYLLTDIDLSFHSQIEEWISVVEKDIENYTKRKFTPVTETRLFDGNGRTAIRIDDALSITKVEVSRDYYGNSFEELSDYLLFPNNTLPKTEIHLEKSWFNKGLQNVRITGVWGYSADVPEDIQFAATVLVAGIINNQKENHKKASESIGDYKVVYGDNKQEKDYQRAMAILDSYTKHFI